MVTLNGSSLHKAASMTNSQTVSTSATDLLTTAQVADHFQVSTRTVRQWLHDGVIRARKRGRVVRIPRSELLRALR